MKNRWIALLLMSALGLGLAAGRVTAEDAAPESPPAMPQPTPGAEHKELAEQVGDWSAAMTFYMPGLGAIESQDSESNTLIMNGWFLQSDYDGSIMDPQGNKHPWKGRSITGFNTHSGEYESTWISQQGSAIGVHKGKKCPKGIIHMHGSMPHFATGKMASSLIMLFPAADDGSRRMEMHWTGADQKPTEKIMQIIYTRKG